MNHLAPRGLHNKKVLLFSTTLSGYLASLLLCEMYQSFYWANWMHQEPHCYCTTFLYFPGFGFKAVICSHGNMNWFLCCLHVIFAQLGSFLIRQMSAYINLVDILKRNFESKHFESTIGFSVCESYSACAADSPALFYVFWLAQRWPHPQ